MSDNKNTEQNSSAGFSFSSFWQELRRRKVIRVATVYLVTGWLVIQIAAATFPSFGIPDWTFRFITLMVLLGLPVALVLAWAFELTPDGIRTIKVPEPANKAESKSGASGQRKNWHAYAFGALVPTIIFGSLALIFFLQADRSGSEIEAAQLEAESLSIAVLPLVNMSSHEENAFFAGGVHEDILTNLSRIRDLQVISRTSMLRYATSDLTLPEIGQALEVDYVVEGSVRRLGDHVRVTIQLIDAATDLHLWANNFERELLDEFATQSALAREISNALHLQVMPDSVEAIEGMPTASVRAFDLYLRAESLEKTEGETEENVIRIREMLEEAATEDPDFVEVWARLKRLYDLQLDRLFRRGWYLQEGQDRNAVAEDLRNRSQRALEKATALNPDNVETLLARAVDHVWPKSWEEMQVQKAILDQIIAQQPDYAKAWYHLGFWHTHLNDLLDDDPAEAINQANASAAFSEAIRLDPFNARMVGAVLNWSRNNGFEEAVVLLSERLNQIIPETADDRRLARVSWGYRSGQIIETFLATADEDLFEDFEQGLQEAVELDDEVIPGVFLLDGIDIAIFKNQPDRALEISHTLFDPAQDAWAPTVFSQLKLINMNLSLERGAMDDALDAARNVLEAEEIILGQTVRSSGTRLATLSTAHSILGNENQARQFADQLLEERGVDFWTLSAMMHVDLEQAVELVLTAAEENNIEVIDTLAAWYSFTLPLLRHPQIQEYYVNEGKWIDYLSARVPEYEPYAQSTSN